MFTPSRRQFVQGLGMMSTAMASGLPGLVFAQQAEFVLKFANILPITHPVNVRAKEAAEAIRRDTQGRVDLQIYPNGQMGSDSDLFTQVRSGAIDFYNMGNGLSTLVPVAAINSVGFAFKDYEQVWAAMDGDLGRHVREQMAKVGLVAMETVWDNGFRHITSSNKPIENPTDLYNFKIRVPPSQQASSMFKALGASPVSISFNEVYSALQTKLADGQENPLALIEAARFYEVQKYCSLTSHIWDGFFFFTSAKSWNRLPTEVRDVVAKHINVAGKAERADVLSLNAQLEGDLKAKGITFSRPDPAPFRAMLQKAGFYSEWRKKYGEQAWTLLEKYTGALS